MVAGWERPAELLSLKDNSLPKLPPSYRVSDGLWDSVEGSGEHGRRDDGSGWCGVFGVVCS